MLDQILTLINAGFTRDEIITLLNQERAGAGAPANPPVSAEPAPVPAAPAVDSPAGSDVVPAPAGSATALDAAGITRAIEDMGRNLIAAMQKAQIGGSTAPAPVDPNAQMDAITAQIINPTHRKEGA